MRRLNREEAIDYFNSRVENDAEMLRVKFPEIGDLLQGRFAKDYNYYDLPNGIIVSRALLQGKKKNPTVGLIIPSTKNPIRIPMDSGFTETILVLEGILSAYVNNDGVIPAEKEASLLKYLGAIISPYEKTLRLKVKTQKNPKDVLYLCQYKWVKTD